MATVDLLDYTDPGTEQGPHSADSPETNLVRQNSRHSHQKPQTQSKTNYLAWGEIGEKEKGTGSCCIPHPAQQHTCPLCSVTKILLRKFSYTGAYTTVSALDDHVQA